MPYLHAVVKELLRKHPPTYFSLTHAVTEPTTLAGYDIPTDVNVEIYLPGISERTRNCVYAQIECGFVKF
ncbi:cytochrome p450 77a3 [Quercus suber]|uniref:Cytochrome p450 77a3 n=1 Tax=Quercus suber TaxID=58331 RepID=A0AAW0JPL5_QUESU